MFTIRRMEERDLEQVVEMEKNIFSDPWSRTSFLDSLNQDMCMYLVVSKQEEIVAYSGVYVIQDEGQITNVAVKADYRNEHIATDMLNELIKRAEDKGAQDFTLEVRESNGAAIHLYEKLGFKSVGTRKNFYENPLEDAMIMWRYK
ncbi:ribosomal protein S18-alanine N-acetyltransferase [Anaerosporobacter sp.]|uniref:ribosomal protein S18-alanine N-acetyltransferase n=1 Tax=Anaerosporobacter sp. TaxID=1872529 RepID=UPI00286F5100|nr:ribosomal protein S18-alanine N-acetyltransferase [Anaerosporobacter sp.]